MPNLHTGGGIVHKAFRGLQQRKGVNFVLEGLQQLQSAIMLPFDAEVTPVLHHQQQCSCCSQPGKRATTQLSSATSLIVHCAKHSWQDFGYDVLQAHQDQALIVGADHVVAMDILPSERVWDAGPHAACVQQ